MAGVGLFFVDENYSILIILAGFLLLSINTITTLDFKNNLSFSLFKLLTVLLFIAIGGYYAYSGIVIFRGLLLAIFFQLLIAIMGLFFTQKK